MFAHPKNSLTNLVTGDHDRISVYKERIIDIRKFPLPASTKRGLFVFRRGGSFLKRALFAEVSGTESRGIFRYQ
jgi:hypothetical protein